MIIYTAPMNTILHVAAVVAKSMSTTRPIQLSKLLMLYFTLLFLLCPVVSQR